VVRKPFGDVRRAVAQVILVPLEAQRKIALDGDMVAAGGADVGLLRPW
jgi:hypothetical protein